jgi:hypothetical protein
MSICETLAYRNVLFSLTVRFFSQTKYPSFQRQLNLYGFARFSHGTDKGAYFHYLFVRGKRSLVKGMVRRKIKGTKVRRPLSASEEPNFYALQWKDENRIGESMPNSVVKKGPIAIAVAVSPHTSPRCTLKLAPLVHLEPLPSRLEEENWDAVDGDLLFFEGSQFHFLEDDLPLEVPPFPTEVGHGNSNSLASFCQVDPNRLWCKVPQA